MKDLGKKFGASLEAVAGDAGKALAYLKERVWMTDYGTLRKNGYYIGSGMIGACARRRIGLTPKTG